MRTELVICLTRCDRCGAEARRELAGHCWGAPDGWTERAVHDCGSTGYTRYDDLCPECSDDE